MNAEKMLEQLTEFYAQRDLLAIDKKRALDDAMPPEVRERMEELEAEFGDKEEAVKKNIAELESAVKEAVLSQGATAKGGSLMAVWNKGRVTWDTKSLDGYVKAHPELEEYRKQGNPSVSIRKSG